MGFHFHRRCKRIPADEAEAWSASARRSDDDPSDQMMQRAADNLLLGALASANEEAGHLGQPMEGEGEGPITGW